MILGGAICIGLFAAFFTPLGSAIVEYSRSVLTKTYPVQVNALEVAENLISFVQNSQHNDLTFPVRFKCTGNHCEFDSTSSQYASVNGYAVRAIAALAQERNDMTLKQSSDAAMAHIMKLCETDVQVCAQKFFAIYDYYSRTNEEQYRAALIRSGDFIWRDARYSLVQDAARADLPAKLEILYTLTRDKRYSETIAAFANAALQKWPNFGGIHLYTSDGYAVNDGMADVASAVLIPAYRVLNDARYLATAEEFFTKSATETHLQSYASEKGMITVLRSVEALLALSKMDMVSEPGRQLHQEQAKRIMHNIVGWQYDTPKRVLFDGKNNLVTGPIDKNSPKNVNYKNVILNAWVALLLLDSDLQQEIFTLLSEV